MLFARQWRWIRFWSSIWFAVSIDNVWITFFTTLQIASMAILLEYQPYWALRPATIAAATSNSYKILSSNSFQNVVTNTWLNGVQENFILVILTIIFPFLLIFKKNFVSHNMKEVIEHSKSFIQEEFFSTKNPESSKTDLVPLSTKRRFIRFYDSPITHFAFTLVRSDFNN